MPAPLPLGYFRIWCQNLVSIQAPVVYETSVDADPFGKLRPRIFPRERLVCFRCMDARVGFEPRLRLMRAASYHCSTSAIQVRVFSTLVALSQLLIKPS